MAMEQTKIKVVWLELPVADFHRAIAFYESIFQTKLDIHELGDLRMATFAHAGIGIALNYHPQFYFPGTQGAIVYFAPAGEPAAMLARVQESGGEIIIPWRLISPEQGSMALFKDSEGNRVGIRG